MKMIVAAPRSHGFGTGALRGMSKNSDSSSPKGVLDARMKTVRKREPCVFVRSQTSGSEPACDAGRIDSDGEPEDAGANGERVSSRPNTSR